MTQRLYCSFADGLHIRQRSVRYLSLRLSPRLYPPLTSLDDDHLQIQGETR